MNDNGSTLAIGPGWARACVHIAPPMRPVRSLRAQNFINKFPVAAAGAANGVNIRIIAAESRIVISLELPPSSQCHWHGVPPALLSPPPARTRLGRAPCRAFRVTPALVGASQKRVCQCPHATPAHLLPSASTCIRCFLVSVLRGVRRVFTCSADLYRRMPPLPLAPAPTPQLPVSVPSKAPHLDRDQGVRARRGRGGGPAGCR